MFNTLRRNVQRLEQLVAKVIEENTNLQTEIGVKLERRHFDLWPLVEALIHDLHPVAGTSSTELINEVPAKTKELTVALKTVHACFRRVFHGRSASSKSIA